MENKELLTIEEVAKFTGLSVGTLYHWVSEKRIPVVRFSPRCIRFRWCDLEAWLQTKTEFPNDARLPRQEAKTR